MSTHDTQDQLYSGSGEPQCPFHEDEHALIRDIGVGLLSRLTQKGMTMEGVLKVFLRFLRGPLKDHLQSSPLCQARMVTRLQDRYQDIHQHPQWDALFLYAMGSSLAELWIRHIPQCPFCVKILEELRADLPSMLRRE